MIQCSKYSIWGKGLTLLHSESTIVMYTNHDDLSFSTITLRMALLSAKGLKIHRHPFEHLSQNTDSHLTLSIFFNSLHAVLHFMLLLLSAEFFKINLKKKPFRNTISVKWFGSRSGPKTNKMSVLIWVLTVCR